MKPLIEILLEYKNLSAAAFAECYPWPVLIHRIKLPDQIDLSAETQFARPAVSGGSSVGAAMLSMGLASTKAHLHLTRAMGVLGGARQAIVDGSIVVFLSSQRPGSEGLSIGRASDAAYSLPYPKISKVHAYVRQEAGSWILVDAGSRNGSLLNGERVPADGRATLKDGALLQLSQLQFLFYTAEGLYRILGED